MDLSELDYDLPSELLAQTPAPLRDASRLLVVDRARGGFEDHVFAELAALGYTDIIGRHLTSDQPKVLSSLARLRRVREALASV